MFNSLMTTKKRDGRAFCSSVPFFGGSIFRVSELIYNEKNIFLILQILHSIYYKQYLKIAIFKIFEESSLFGY